MRTLSPALRLLDVYETRATIFISGYDVLHGGFRLLEIPRPLPGGAAGSSALNLNQHPTVFSRSQLDELLKSRQVSLGSKLVSGGYCLFGFVRMLESHYLVVVAQAESVASLHGHEIYAITENVYIPITYKPRKTMEETRYKAMLTSTDFTNGYYFSYTYDLTSSMQRNHLNMDASAPSGPRDGSSPGDKSQTISLQDMFIWNLHPLKPLLNLPNTPSNTWVVPIVYGFLEQRTVRLEDGHLLKYTLIARRSRHFAGTRYLRRGVDNQGYVANEVETEQIVTIESGLYKLARSSSLVQIRGSIPLYWCHVNLITPSPDIRIEGIDKDYRATRMHFNRLVDRYGAQVAVLNLVRQNDGGREVMLGKAFGSACAALNTSIAQSEEAEERKKSSLTAIPLYALTQLVTVFGIISIGGGGSGSDQKVGHSDTDADDDIDDDDDGQPEEGPDDSAGCNSNSSSEKSIPLSYLAFDLLDGHSHHDGPTVFDTLTEIGKAIYPRTGFFVQTPFGKNTYTSFPNVEADPCLAVLFENPAGEGGSDGPSASQVNDVTPRTAHDVEGAPAFLEPRGPILEIDEEPSDLELRPMRGSTSPPLCVAERGTPPYSPVDSSEESTSEESKGSSARSYIKSETEAQDGSDDAETFEEEWGSDATAGPGAPCGLLQRGVLRTNCIDCLDRTNIGQFTYAKFVLPFQLKALGIHLQPAGLSAVLLILMEAWARHGDEIAKQYGGSGAMHRVDVKGSSAGTTEFAMTGGIQNGVVAINRYYNNISVDAEKQQSIDLLLGVFEPKRGSPNSWDLDLGPTSKRGSLPPSVDSLGHTTSEPPAVADAANADPPTEESLVAVENSTEVKLESFKMTPFFSEAHFDKHSITSFKTLRECEHNAIHVDKIPLDSCPVFRRQAPPPFESAWDPHSTNFDDPDFHRYGSSFDEPSRRQFEAYVNGESLRYDARAARSTYDNYINVELNELPKLRPDSSLSQTSSLASSSSSTRRESAKSTTSSIRESITRWRSEKRDPLLGTEASAASSSSGKHIAPASLRERLGSLPGRKLDAANRGWLGADHSIHHEENDMASFPTFGLRRGSRKAGADESDDEVTDEPKPKNEGLLSPIGLQYAADWIPSETLNPFNYLSGLFRGAGEKKIER